MVASPCLQIGGRRTQCTLTMRRQRLCTSLGRELLPLPPFLYVTIYGSCVARSLPSPSEPAQPRQPYCRLALLRLPRCHCTAALSLSPLVFVIVMKTDGNLWNEHVLRVRTLGVMYLRTSSRPRFHSFLLFSISDSFNIKPFSDA